MAVQPTLLNGRVHDWVSLIISLGAPIGKVAVSVMAVTYPEHGSEKTLYYGTGKNPIGYTRDAYKPTTLEMDFLASEWDSFRNQMGPGYGFREIEAIALTYQDLDADLVTRTDVFRGLSIVKEQPSVSQGTDPLKIHVIFQPNQMVLGGVGYALPTRNG
jgi:hypothetical protein